MKRSMFFTFLIMGLLLIIYFPAVLAASGIDVTINQVQGSPSKDYSKITITYSVENTGSVSVNEPIAIRYDLVSMDDQNLLINLGSDIIRRLPSAGHNAAHTVTFPLDTIPPGRYYLQVIFDPDNDLSGKIKTDYTFSSKPNTIYIFDSKISPLKKPTPVRTKNTVGLQSELITFYSLPETPIPAPTYILSTINTQPTLSLSKTPEPRNPQPISTIYFAPSNNFNAYSSSGKSSGLATRFFSGSKTNTKKGYADLTNIWAPSNYASTTIWTFPA